MFTMSRLFPLVAVARDRLTRRIRSRGEFRHAPYNLKNLSRLIGFAHAVIPCLLCNVVLSPPHHAVYALLSVEVRTHSGIDHIVERNLRWRIGGRGVITLSVWSMRLNRVAARSGGLDVVDLMRLYVIGRGGRVVR